MKKNIDKKNNYELFFLFAMSILVMLLIVNITLMDLIFN